MKMIQEVDGEGFPSLQSQEVKDQFLGHAGALFVDEEIENTEVYKQEERKE